MISEKTGSKVFVFSKNNYKSNNVSTITYSDDDNSATIYKKLMLFISECEREVFDGGPRGSAHCRFGQGR
jgi:hypothetical protein